MAFHEFSRSLARISRSSKLQPLFPIRPVPLKKVESVIIYDTINTKPASTNASQILDDRPTVPDKIKYWQKYYEENLDKPTYLMRGTIDKVLFGISCAGMVLGLAVTVDFILPLFWIK